LAFARIRNQLPPSSFFKTLIDDEEADDDENVLSESVLEMANGAFRPARRLRWHYRSRHSGLIKFSNRLVYDDQLIAFPSATEAMSRMGVEFRAVKGRYKAGTNPVEAKTIIESIIEFMQNDPDRSLGVVTLNQRQRDLIMEEFEYAIANNRAVQRYIDTWKEKNDGLEEFFIKNLENVQGDERDVIFIGTVYGAEEPGARVMQRFGPINGLAGRRRLNVLFTRAKQKVVTFSSMTAADIEADERNAGAYMLKRWLEYTASGVLDVGEETENEPDSEFEVFVIDQIRSMGCKPVPQVGVAGYFVDIGIRHPEWPHGFILGVECDGATYHSAKSARDRDRLRQEILENLGWRLHRIWSTDWFNNPGQEADRLRRVIIERLAELKAREHENALFHEILAVVILICCGGSDEAVR
jgi:very-short-patch-repair endonuclease